MKPFRRLLAFLSLQLFALPAAVRKSETAQLTRLVLSSAGREFSTSKKEALLKKAMTTKFPSTLVLMETVEELSAKNCELQLQWVRRDLNQLAHDPTNEEVGSSTPA